MPGPLAPLATACADFLETLAPRIRRGEIVPATFMVDDDGKALVVNTAFVFRDDSDDAALAARPIVDVMPPDPNACPKCGSGKTTESGRDMRLCLACNREWRHVDATKGA